ncbi:MAG: hypothetical protein V4597_02390, partial [Pseudomonadota bacterium]
RSAPPSPLRGEGRCRHAGTYPTVSRNNVANASPFAEGYLLGLIPAVLLVLAARRQAVPA